MAVGLKPKRTSTPLKGKVQSIREMARPWPDLVTGGSSDVKSSAVFTAWALPKGVRKSRLAMTRRPLLLTSPGVQLMSPEKSAAPSAWRNATSSGDKVPGCNLPAANAICGAAIWAVPTPFAIV